MSVQDYDKNMRPDEEFVKGDYCFLVPGNKCRLLDGRRTSRVIGKYFEDSGMFKWRITKYEDQGEYWKLPAEDIKKFQLEKDSKKLDQKKVSDIKATVRKYNTKVTIEASPEDKKKTQNIIKETKEQAQDWLEENSKFFKKSEEIDFTRKKGYESLYHDIENYMEEHNLLKQENLTTNSFVLNPNSGEWIKGLKIMLAELGLVPYKGKKIRTDDIFKGAGNKLIRRKYIINRTAFLQALFELLKIKEVVVYRGMSTEKDWLTKERTFLSTTFNRSVAEAFSSLDRDSKYKNSYLFKMTYPTDKLFMTFFETADLNKQYKEAEAIILYNKEVRV